MRQKIGTAFLIVTILLVTTALANGGWWWFAVLCSTAVTLWGVGFKSSEK